MNKIEELGRSDHNDEGSNDAECDIFVSRRSLARDLCYRNVCRL